MRRAKMLLRPKLGPTVKQNQPQQVQPQTSKSMEHVAQLSTASETALMPPPAAPPSQAASESPQSPKRDAPSSATETVVRVSDPETQIESTEETSSCREIVLSNPSTQKSIAVKAKPAKANLELESATPLPTRRERKPTKKADEFREMLMASRRRFGKVREPIDTSKLTMLDLIYYNPPGAPMKKKATEAMKIVEKLEQQSLEPELEEDSNTADSTKGVTEDEVMGPRVVVGPDGEITIDETSLVIRRPNPLESKHKLKVTVEEAGKARYNSFKTRKMKKCTWTTKETSKFYQALSICGTDFTLMTQFFPSRSRQDLKNKFKREEKSNSALIDKAIHHPTQFEYTDFEMEDIAKDDNEPQKTKSPRSGAKGTRKRKAKATDSVENELLAIVDKPTNEKFSSLRVSRPKRNRARVDYAGLNESTQDLDDASPSSHEQEKDIGGALTEGSEEQAVEESSESVEATVPSSTSTSLGDSGQSRSPTRMENETAAVFEVSPEVIDEVSQMTELIQPQEPPADILEIGDKKIEALTAEKPAQPVPRASARKIPALVFKPRHRKAALRPNELKKTNAQKSLLTAYPVVSTPPGETESVKETHRISLEEEKPSPAGSGIETNASDTFSGSDAALEESVADQAAVDKPSVPIACPDASDDVSRSVEVSSRATKMAAADASVDRAPKSSTSSDTSPISKTLEALTRSPAAANVDTQTKDVSSDTIGKIEKNSGDSKSAILPKLVLPSRPMTNRIIRPIGAAKARGIVLSPVTKRRSEPAKEEDRH